MVLALISCSEDNSKQNLNRGVDYTNSLKADDDILDKISKFLKKKVKLKIEFGTPTATPDGTATICVGRGLCTFEGEISFGAANGAGGYDSNGDFLLMFEKATMTSSQIDVQFEGGVFELNEAITVPHEGIYEGNTDQDLVPGTYDVIFEDSEVLVVNFE